MCNIEEQISKVADDIQELLEELREAGWVVWDVPGQRRPGQRGRKKQAEPLLHTLAEQGVELLTIDHHGDDTATVRINRSAKMELPPTLVDLLEILSEDTDPDGEDSFVSFKSLAELALRLGKKGKRTYKNHAVSQLLLRLRRKLERCGINPYLVQTNRRLGGYRFALKRGATRVIDGVIEGDRKILEGL